METKYSHVANENAPSHSLPKFKFTRDEITSAAMNLTRKAGLGGLTARVLAEELGCSVKPIFGLFKNMEEVQGAVLSAAQDLYQSYLAEDMAVGKYPPYKASGMGYIRFAREEKELFKLLFMCDRKGEPPKPGKEMDVIIPLIMKKHGAFQREGGVLSSGTVDLRAWHRVHDRHLLSGLGDGNRQ